jgi:hypothetical protein
MVKNVSAQEIMRTSSQGRLGLEYAKGQAGQPTFALMAF